MANLHNVKKLFLLTLFFCVALIPATAATHVAVLETVSENGVIGRSEKMFLTDKLRERAKSVLPAYMGYVIMTRENIVAMLPPGKSLEECEGSCLAETGKNISADYVAQAHIGKFGSQYTLTLELYETAGSNLVGSFTARKTDADGLLDEIEKKADDIFKQILNTVPIATTDEEDVGIKNFTMTSTGYQRKFKVQVESNPAGAEFTVDGHQSEKCSTTPCIVTLSLGNHRFVFTKDMYARIDTIVEITKKKQHVQASLLPDFGTLFLQPVFVDQMGSIASASVFIDGKAVKGDEHILSTGNHKVTLDHHCYEKVGFDVKVGQGSKIKFDRELQPIMGGLNLKVVKGDLEEKNEIFINGKSMGFSPLKMTVPICATITVKRKNSRPIPVRLKAGETIDYTYNIAAQEFFSDPRDGHKYYAINVDNKLWMAENLNYKSDDSWCYRNKAPFCNLYGRLYTWESAMKICPDGWHLPSIEEYNQLLSHVSNKNIPAREVKSKKGWSGSGNGKDVLGLNILPAGGGRYGTNYNNAGKEAYFWTSDKDGNDAIAIFMTYNDDEVTIDGFEKYNGFSVRCIADD